MITSATFTNFRCFPTYRMEGLARVNLLVGKNNSGKTALLEGLQFLASGGDLRVLLDAAERRNELEVVEDDGRIQRLKNVSAQFYGFRPELGSGFRIACVSLAEFFGSQQDLGASDVSATIANQTDRALAGLVDGKGGPYLLAKRRGSYRGFLPLSSSDRGYLAVASPLAFRWVTGATAFVPPGSFSEGELGVFYDAVTLAAKEHAVVSALQVLDERVVSVHGLIGDPGAGRRGGRFVVGLSASNGLPSRVPLGSLGDGMRRVLALVCAATSVANGSLFVDEIDSGIHYTAMDSLWKVMLNLAKELDIQVFATTHSWDCIAGLSRLVEAEPELLAEVAVHKIASGFDSSIRFAGNEIPLMNEAGIDPR